MSAQEDRQRLVRLDLPWPLEPMLLQTLAIEAPDRRHEELILAWEATLRIMACVLVATAEHVGAASPALAAQRAALARPSLGHWAGLIRAASGALAGRSEAAVVALQPLLEGLTRRTAENSGLAPLLERLRHLPGKQLGALKTLHDVIQNLSAYRNAAQSTHDSVASAFRQASCGPLFDGLLALAEAAPLVGNGHLVVVGRLERDETGERADLYHMHGSGPVHESTRLGHAAWDRLHKGRPYLWLPPELFLPLFPLAAAELVDSDWRLGWLTGKVHSPTLAYHAGPRGSFQVPVSEPEYYGLLGGDAEERSASPQLLAREPYKGLHAYSEADAPVFFGREEETAEAIDRLLRQGMLILLGASGSGKSSLLGAGVLPELRRRAEAENLAWRALWMRPGAQPLRELRRALLNASPTDPASATAWSRQVAELLPDDPARVQADALAHLLAGLTADGGRVVLCVDQLEEAATLCSDAAQRRAFVGLLTHVAEQARDLPAQLALTVRADLLAGLLEEGGFRRLLDGHSQSLGGIPRERLLRVITEPLRGRQVELEAGLAETIVAEVGEQPGTLALLSLVLDTLWDDRARWGYQLTKQAYAKAGRVEGVLRTQADAARDQVLANANAAQVTQEIQIARLDAVLLQLAQRTEEGGFARRRAHLDAVAQALKVDPATLRNLVEPLVNKRLLVLNDAKHGDPNDAHAQGPAAPLETGAQTLEVAHEALLTGWPYYRDLLQAHDEALTLRQAVEASAEAWERSGRKREWWSDDTSRLRRAEELLTQHRLHVPDRDRQFLAACRRRVVLQTRIKQGVAAGLALLTLISGFATIRVWEGKREVERTLAEADFREGTRLLEDGEFGKGMAYLSRAIRTTGNSPSTRRVLSELLNGRVTLPNIIFKQQGSILQAAFSPDGQRVVTGSNDNTARVWDVATGRPLTNPLQHSGDTLRIVEFSPDGKLLLTAGDSLVRVWDTDTEQTMSAPFDVSTPDFVGFSSDGQRVLVVDEESAKTFYINTRYRTGKTFPLRLGSSAVYSHDGDLLAIIENNGVQIYNAISGNRAFKTIKHDDPINDACFSYDNAMLVTASGLSLYLWNTKTGELIDETSHSDSEALDSVYCSPYSHQIVASYKELQTNGYKTLGITTNIESRFFGGDEIFIDQTGFNGSFSPDGTMIVSVIKDTATIWSVNSGNILSEINQKDLTNAVFSPDARSVLLSSQDGTTGIWEAISSQPLPALLKEMTNSNTKSPNGRLGLATSSCPATNEDFSSSVVICDLARGVPITRPLQHEEPVRSFTFSPDGQQVVTATYYYARVWDINTGLPLTTKLYEHYMTFADFALNGNAVLTSGNKSRIWPLENRSFHGPVFSMLINKLGVHRFNDLGGLEPTLPVTRAELTQHFQGREWESDAETNKITNWLIADPRERTVSPWNPTTVRSVVERLIEEGTEASLNDALDHWPGHPLALVKLARLHVEDQPDTAAVWARLAERNADTETPPNPAAKVLAQQVLADLTKAGHPSPAAGAPAELVQPSRPAPAPTSGRPPPSPGRKRTSPPPESTP